MSYIPKQEKRTRERVEAKLDLEVIRKLECYCEYLESDRDYVIAKALEIAFQKDKDFAEWLQIQPESMAGSSPDALPAKRPGRRAVRKTSDVPANTFQLTSPRPAASEPQGR